MKVILFLFGMTISLSAFPQRYEYAQIFQSQISTNKNRASFYFGNKYDSIKQYGQYEHLIDALDKADQKGWEVVNIVTNFMDTTNPAIGQTTIVYIRRKKPLTH